jgi:hypothetical protein
MRDRPETALLLALAAELEQIPEEAALVARARAIAGRERQAGNAPIAACHRALIALYGAGDFEVLFRRLAQEIRDGAYDAPGAERERVLRLLRAVTLQKLRESNPDYLKATGVPAADWD